MKHNPNEIPSQYSKSLIEDGCLLVANESGVIKDIVFWNCDKKSSISLGSGTVNDSIYTIHCYAMKFILKNHDTK